MAKTKKALNRLLSVFLCVLVIFSIFNINIVSHAEIALATTAGLAVLATGLLACGIVLTSDKGFRQACTDAWNATTERIRNTISTVTLVAGFGGHLVAKWTKEKWAEFTDYVSETFSPTETTEISGSEAVADITLIDGTVLRGNPQVGDLQKFFVIRYASDGIYRMIEINSSTASCEWNGSKIYTYSRTSTPIRVFKYIDNEWVSSSTISMVKNQVYQGSMDWWGVPLSVQLGTTIAREAILFTSIPFTYNSGTLQLPAEEVPPMSSGISYAVPEADYFPSSGVLSPPISIPQGGSLGVSIPTTHDGTLGEDVIDLGRIGTLNPADVNTKVDDVVVTGSEVVVESKDIAVSDTVVGDITATDTTDSDTANKFKLPQVALTKFPFCIPFDLYNSITVMSAPPVTPHWEIPFVIKSLGIHHTITIDFEKFDSLAVICRWFLSAIWVLCLILITRKLSFT